METDLYMALFNLTKSSINVCAGANKLRAFKCTSCFKPPIIAPFDSDLYMKIPNGVFPFKDELSAKEYQLSGMCQTCQDTFFD